MAQLAHSRSLGCFNFMNAWLRVLFFRSVAHKLYNLSFLTWYNSVEFCSQSEVVFILCVEIMDRWDFWRNAHAFISFFNHILPPKFFDKSTPVTHIIFHTTSDAASINRLGFTDPTSRPWLRPLADPELQKQGAKFLPKFFNDFLGVPDKISAFPPKLASISQNFWWLLLVIDLFNVLMWYFSVGGGKSVPDIDTGGAKILTFTQIYNAIITLSAPEGGQTLLPTSMGGHGRICPPWIRHWLRPCLK